ncbi:MAG: lycopene cyclase domain-containing protein [Candidatus Doudnabacteria bacterium]|nr:lycopene cyclase domain-containing protein [Candidatus Doudnabacteria bacterium]
MKQKGSNLKLVLILTILGLLVLILGSQLPSYTRLALVFLILPTLFVFLKNGNHIDKKKLLVTCFLAIIATIIWDNIAIEFKVWDFPMESVIGWLFGAPIEEYFFAFWIVAMSVGIYTSLHKKRTVINVPHFKIVPLIMLVAVLQILVLYSLIFHNPESYIKWLLVFAIIPSFFYIFRKGEKISYPKLILTASIMGLITIPYDYIFMSHSWYHYDTAIIGRIVGVPIDDILFSFFTSITIIGFYTSVPHNHPFTGKWLDKDI